MGEKRRNVGQSGASGCQICFKVQPQSQPEAEAEAEATALTRCTYICNNSKANKCQKCLEKMISSPPPQ